MACALSTVLVKSLCVNISLVLIIGWKELFSMVFSIGVGIVVKLSFME